MEDMENTNLDALHNDWRRAVAQYAQERREAERDRVPARELKRLDLLHNLRIDVAYARFRNAQALEELRQVCY